MVNRKYTNAALYFTDRFGNEKFEKNVTPEEYAEKYANDERYVLKCPCLRRDGKTRCVATLSFTRGSHARVAYFSADDINTHAIDCLIGNNGKVRFLSKESPDCVPGLEFNFGKAPTSSDGEQDSEEVEDSKELINNTVSNAETSSEESTSFADNHDNLIEDNMDTDDEKSESSSFSPGNKGSEKPASALKKSSPQKIRTLAAMFEVACSAKAEKADSNGRLICDSIICKKTNHLMLGDIINHDSGDPLILVADKDGGFSTEYAGAIQEKGEILLVFKNHYGDDHESVLYAIDIGTIRWPQSKKIWNKYKKDDTKTPVYNPKTFIIGAVYKRREEKTIEGMKRIIHVLSLYSPKFLILYSPELEAIDNNHPFLK